MAYESLVGKNSKVSLGTIAANTVLGMGTWSIGGGSVATLDDTEFGDEHQDLVLGLFTGGTVSFSGLHKIDDVSGIDLLIKAYHLRSGFSDMRFWCSSGANYYRPNSSALAGGGLPAGVPMSIIYITSEPQIGMDRSGLASISFSGIVVGAMRLE